MALMDSWLQSQGEKLVSSLKASKGEDEREKVVYEFLESMESSSKNFKIPDFEANLKWLNCTEPLSFSKQLQGKLCVLDFFTYCCINCMHILPDLEAVEEQFSSDKDGVVILGVHSAKFENEKSSANILSAVLRYDIRHAVVNDSEATLWNSLSVQCWPTLVVVGPDGTILTSFVGEGHREELLLLLKFAVKSYKAKGKIKEHSVNLSLAKDTLPQTGLLFPGKITTDESGQRLVVSDTGHHRILVLSREGVVHHSIGGGKKFEFGFVDGGFGEARFRAPQGVAFLKEKIYVADTENHAIRMIDLKSKTVSTLAGNGSQGSDKEGGKKGKEQEISSPWDVATGPAPGAKGEENSQESLYVAMAGTHQVWTLYLKDGTWLKGGSQSEGTCLRFAGSGAEENRNNSYPHKAAFAQPSGLSIAVEKPFRCVFIADSESSSVRSIDLTTGATKALVGADRDPTNLFAFGDVDGKGVDVKLQHPLGVSWNSHTQLLYVTDSYNHKIKVVDPAKKTCTTFLGTGKSGHMTKENTVQFDEPGGLCVSPDGQQLYVADTNNHTVLAIDIESKKVSKLPVIEQYSGDSQTKEKAEHNEIKRFTSAKTPIIRREAVHVISSRVQLTLNVHLPRGCHMTDGAISMWQVFFFDKEKGEQSSMGLERFQPRSGVLSEGSLSAVSQISWPEEWAQEVTLQIEAVIYFCEPSGTCRMEEVLYDVPLVKSDNEQATHSVVIDHNCEVP